MDKPSNEELEDRVSSLKDKIDADQAMHEAELTAKDNKLFELENAVKLAEVKVKLALLRQQGMQHALEVISKMSKAAGEKPAE